jgi:acyl-coenzyme A thioesterase PaaI-like protein
VAESLFEPVDGDRWLPTELSRGPWSLDSLHGGPVAALLARAASAASGAERRGEAPLHPARLTVELLRPIPLSPLSVKAAVVRPGRKVELVEASMDADGREVARATLLGIRAAAIEVPESTPAAFPPGPSHGDGTIPDELGGAVAFHNSGVEHRFVLGRFDRPGPATDWIRLRWPVVPGEEPTALERTVAAADFGNGISRLVPFEELIFINPDLTVYLHRLPAGEWVCLEATTILGGDGVGMTESALYDEQGAIGRAVQSLLLDVPR